MSKGKNLLYIFFINKPIADKLVVCHTPISTLLYERFSTLVCKTFRKVVNSHKNYQPPLPILIGEQYQ